MTDKDPQPSTDTSSVLLEELKAELDEAIAARKRALADFANFQKRAAGAELRAEQSGSAGVAKSLLGVLDHFDLALGQPSDKLTVEQLLDGVRIVRDELLKALATHGVERLEPKVGEPFDPHRHQAMMRAHSDDVPPNHITSVLQAGYIMGQSVLRPAKIVVSAPPDDAESDVMEQS